MASKLRSPGLSKPSASTSKLARPHGTGLRPLSGSGVRRASPQPHMENARVPRQPSAPVGMKKAVGQVKQIRPQAVKQSSPVQPSGGGMGGQTLEIGDRVLVNGKHGTLAFLGPTQFAKGEWAGIVLDSLEGKNNGSVNGVQYFDCEPNRGLFSKPEKIKLVSKGASPSTAAAMSHSILPSQAPSTSSSASVASQFNVGDKVLVDGQKEGTVGFIGTTQFARGIWAGVILGTRDGKNDGTVSGVRYFECEQDHGLFTRPMKLRLISRASGVTPSLEPRQNDHQEGGQRSASETPVDLKALHNQLKIGDQVLVSGVKEGILRFLGPTEFAKGIWVGVELPEPMGKNDGAISGKRYFQCEPKHGLFAPLPKVEKLATAGSAAPSVATSSPASSPFHSPKVHANRHNVDQGSGKVVLPSGLARHRHPSESSISSFGSSRMVQEQQTGSSLQGSTATDLACLVQERDAEIETLQATLDQREKEKIAHQEELTELRRQVDDLQFQLEEKEVISGDQLESATETSDQKVADLTRELEEERRLTQQLRDQLESSEGHGTGGGSSEEQEQLKKTLEERTQEVSAQLEQKNQLQMKLDEKAQEVSNRLEQEKKLQAELQKSNEEISTHLETIALLETELEQARETMSDAAHDQGEVLAMARRDLELERNRLSVLKRDLHQTEQNLKTEKERYSTLEQELIQTKANFDAEKIQLSSLERELSSVKSHHGRASSLERDIVDMEKAAQGLRRELSTTQQEMQEAMDLCSQQESLLVERNKELASMEEKIRQLSKEQDLWASEKSRLQSEQERLIGERDQAIAECDKLMAQSTNASLEQSELSHQRRGLLTERDTLLAQQQAMQTEYEKLVSERDDLLHTLNEIQNQKQDVLQASQEVTQRFSSTQAELMKAQFELEKLREELSSSREDWESEKLTLQEQIEIVRASATEIERKVSDAAMERDATLQEAQELAEKLEKAQTERDSLKLELETAQVHVDELQFQLAELNTRHQSLEEESTTEVLQVQQRIESMEVLLAEREREMAAAQEKISTLTEDLIASQGKRDHAMLEEEKLLLEERVKELILQLDMAQEKSRRDSKSLASISIPGENESKSSRLEEAQTQLLEAQALQEDLKQEIEDYKQQTEFLNSVIADLQNKLEGVEAMKGLHGAMGSLSDYAGDDDGDALLESLPPPRLFCDICDVFDQHDTDDCPLQTMSDSPPPSMHHGIKAPGGSDRPYCDNCEIFGHWTDECEYEATY